MRRGVVHILGLLCCLVANYSVNGGHRGNVVCVTNAISEQSVSDFPGKHCWIGLFVVRYCVHHLGGCHFGLGAADDTGPDASRFIISSVMEKSNGEEEANKPIRVCCEGVLDEEGQRLSSLAAAWLPSGFPSKPAAVNNS